MANFIYLFPRQLKLKSESTESFIYVLATISSLKTIQIEAIEELNTFLNKKNLSGKLVEGSHNGQAPLR